MPGTRATISVSTAMVIDRNDVSGPVGDHSHANPDHNDGYIAPSLLRLAVPRPPYAVPCGRPAHQRRGFAAFDAGHSGRCRHPVRFSKTSRSLALPASIRQRWSCQRPTHRHAPRARRCIWRRPARWPRPTPPAPRRRGRIAARLLTRSGPWSANNRACFDRPAQGEPCVTGPSWRGRGYRKRRLANSKMLL